MIFVQKVFSCQFSFGFDDKKTDAMRWHRKLLRGKAIKVFYQCYYVKEEKNDEEEKSRAMFGAIDMLICGHSTHFGSFFKDFVLFNSFGHKKASLSEIFFSQMTLKFKIQNYQNWKVSQFFFVIWKLNSKANFF